MSKQLLLVNYHYVRKPDAHPYPGIHPISPEAFAQQVERLARHLHIATPQEVEAFVLEGRSLPRDSVLITFDDGLVDHAETARDILDPLGLKAVFFVCSRPLTEERAVSGKELERRQGLGLNAVSEELGEAGSRTLGVAADLGTATLMCA